MNKIFKIVLVLFFLFDYYFEVFGRMLDYVGLLMLLIYMMHTYSIRAPIMSFYRVKPFFQLNVFFWIVFGLVGIFRGGIITVGAYLIGAFLIFPLYYYWGLKSSDAVKRITKFLIALNLFFFFVQYFIYKITGVVINFHAIPGLIQPRTYNEGLIFFRAAGLYQEPSQYALAMIMIVTLWAFISRKPFGTLCLICLFSILLSESLWGIGAIVVYVMLFSRSMLFKLVFVGGVVSLIAIIMLTPSISGGLISAVSIERIANFQDDPSTSLRLGVNANSESSFSILKIIGSGLSTSSFQATGANGLNFYIISFGYIGFFIWILSFFTSLKRKPLIVFVTVSFIMTSYPIFTYLIWWAWLALVFSNLNNDELWK